MRILWLLLAAIAAIHLVDGRPNLDQLIAIGILIYAVSGSKLIPDGPAWRNQ